MALPTWIGIEPSSLTTSFLSGGMPKYSATTFSTYGRSMSRRAIEPPLTATECGRMIGESGLGVRDQRASAVQSVEAEHVVLDGQGLDPGEAGVTGVPAHGLGSDHGPGGRGGLFGHPVRKA